MGATLAIPSWFLDQMTRMIGLKFAPADMVTHWEALADVPEPILVAAVSRAQKIRIEFPSPAELREDCDAVAHLARHVEPEPDRGQDLPERVTLGTLPTGKIITAERVWTYYHEDCGDTGTQSLWCGEPGPTMKPWQLRQACERRTPHDPHEWARRCTCWESNPALIRKRESQQKFADQKAGKR